MANLIRSAKYGSDWTENDLDAYNISVQNQDTATFFHVDSMPPPVIDGEILTKQEVNDMASDDRDAELMDLLDLAMKPAPDEESDFAVDLFKHLGYVKRHRVARTRKDIPYLICGEWRHARTDICLVDRGPSDILLLVQDDERFQPKDLRDPEPQLIAEAIAAFESNNRIRKTAGQTPHESKKCSSYPLRMRSYIH